MQSIECLCVVLNHRYFIIQPLTYEGNRHVHVYKVSQLDFSVNFSSVTVDIYKQYIKLSFK